MKKRLLLIYIFLTSSLIIHAGTTGKIKGKVTDAENGEPIPGINIILEGTATGAATDIDGIYIINNITPGKYRVIASGVGYQRKIFEDVQVNADFTTELDFTMSVESITVETVVVKAEAKMIRKDLTSSHTSINSAEIESLPVESVNQILSLQAGITEGVGGELHIRGGRSNEIAYTVNGISLTNPYNHGNTVSIATNAIQELSVVSGTFNAEYGNALSGIVNTVTKEGGSKFNGSLSFYTGDYISSRTGVFDNIDDMDPLNSYVAEMTFSGPIPYLEKYSSFFVSGRYSDWNGYLYGRRQHTIYDSTYKNPLDPTEIRVVSTGDGKIVPMSVGYSLSTTGKLTVRPTSTFKINYDLLYSQSESKGYSHTYKFNPDAVGTGFNWGILNSIEIRHALSSKTFYTLRGSYNLEDSKSYLFPLLDSSGNEVDFHAGMSLGGLSPDPRYQPSHKSGTSPAPYSFSTGGTTSGHFYQRTNTVQGKFDITSQLNKNHEVKTGIQIRTHTINYHYFSILRDSTRYFTPTIPEKRTTLHNVYKKHPFEFSAYIQDKMEFESIVLNAGVRYDYFTSNSKYSSNTFYPTPYSPILPSGIDTTALLADADAKLQISPRVGFSFPITDRGIIHFSYGHFFQLPPLSYLYSNSEYEYSFGTPTYGNANLNPEKTISYEIGLQQQLTDDIAFNVTGYYKDVRDLLASQQVRISGDETYITYVNKDYANIKGITFSMKKRRTSEDYFGATLDYTFQTAEGNDVNSDAFFLDLSSGRQSEKVPVPLDWDKQHQLNMTASFGKANDWNVTFVGKIGTGLPYTPQLLDDQVFLRRNSDRRPIQSRVDLLAEKSFEVEGLEMTLFLKVFNLFDQLNERFVYANTGRATYSLEETRPQAEETDRLASLIDGVHTSEEYFKRPNYYYPPREVRLGLSVEL